MNKVIPPGFLIEVTSEASYSGSNRTHYASVSTLDKAKKLVEALWLFKCWSNDPEGLGNTTTDDCSIVPLKLSITGLGWDDLEYLVGTYQDDHWYRAVTSVKCFHVPGKIVLEEVLDGHGLQQ